MAKTGQKFMMQGPYNYLTKVNGQVVIFPPNTPFEVTDPTDRKTLRAAGFTRIVETADADAKE